jgi:hypothetical protein
VPYLLHLGGLLALALELDQHDDTPRQKHEAVVAADDTVRPERAELDRLATNLVDLGDEALLGDLLKATH